MLQWACVWLMLQRCLKGFQGGWGHPTLGCALCEWSHKVTDLGTRNCLLRSTSLLILILKTSMKGRLCFCSSQEFRPLCPWNHKSLCPYIKSSTSWLKPCAAKEGKFKCWAPVNTVRYSQKEKYCLLFPELLLKPHPFIKALKAKPFILHCCQGLALKFPTPCNMINRKWTRTLGSTE